MRDRFKALTDQLTTRHSTALVLWELACVSTLMTRKPQLSTQSASMRIPRESTKEPLPTAGILTS
jgi:hypothetical protein